MRFDRIEKRREQGEPVLPLINIVFLLLIFFMIAGKLTSADPFEVTPPDSTAEALPDGEAPSLLLAADGRLAFEGEPVERAALPGLLAALRAEGRLERLRLRADGALHGTLLALLIEPPRRGAAAGGEGGLEIALGPSGGAPGTVTESAATEEARAAETPTAEAVEAGEVPAEAVSTEDPPTEQIEPEIAEPEAVIAEAAPAAVPETAAAEALPISEALPEPPAEAPRIAEAELSPAPVEPRVAETAPAETVTAAEEVPETPVAAQAAPPTTAPAPAAPPPAKPEQTRPIAQPRPPAPQVATRPEPATPQPATPQPDPAAPETAGPGPTEGEREAEAGSGGEAGTADSADAGAGEDRAGGGNPGAAADYLARLQAWLERHKEYPSRARQRRQEGTALLQVEMDRDGRVLSYRLENSAGHAALDREVEAMIRRASPLPPLPPEMPQQRLSFVVPVEFRIR